jgi:hypothetical protein
MYAITPNPSSFKLGWRVVRERENGDKIDWLTHEEAIFAMRALEKRAWDMNDKTSLALAPRVVADVKRSAFYRCMAEECKDLEFCTELARDVHIQNKHFA